MDPRLPLLQTVRALTSVIDASDPFTRGRSLRISRFVVRVARELGVPEAELVDVEFGALLHDLGRNAILHDVIQSPRPLDAGERAVVQTHPTIGRDMIKDIPGLEAAAEIVWTHHERPDGAGYPRNLAADQIPIGARVIMVCAAYDAMTETAPTGAACRRGPRARNCAAAPDSSSFPTWSTRSCSCTTAAGCGRRSPAPNWKSGFGAETSPPPERPSRSRGARGGTAAEDAAAAGPSRARASRIALAGRTPEQAGDRRPDAVA